MGSVLDLKARLMTMLKAASSNVSRYPSGSHWERLHSIHSILFHSSHGIRFHSRIYDSSWFSSWHVQDQVVITAKGRGKQRCLSFQRQRHGNGRGKRGQGAIRGENCW